MNRDGLAIVLSSHEKGIPANIKAIKDELEEGAGGQTKAGAATECVGNSEYK